MNLIFGPYLRLVSQDGKMVWMSTCGTDVHWIHMRLDSSPKHYSHQPYKEQRGGWWSKWLWTTHDKYDQRKFLIWTSNMETISLLFHLFRYAFIFIVYHRNDPKPLYLLFCEKLTYLGSFFSYKMTKFYFNEFWVSFQV